MLSSLKAGLSIHKIKSLNGRLFNKLLREHSEVEFNSEQGKILSSLYHQQPQTLTDLFLHLGLARNTLTAMLKRLEETNFIQSQVYQKDKR